MIETDFWEELHSAARRRRFNPAHWHRRRFWLQVRRGPRCHAMAGCATFGQAWRSARIAARRAFARPQGREALAVVIYDRMNRRFEMGFILWRGGRLRPCPDRTPGKSRQIAQEWPRRARG